MKRILGTADDYRRLYGGGVLSNRTAALTDGRSSRAHSASRGDALLVPWLSRVCRARYSADCRRAPHLRILDCGCGTATTFATFLAYGRTFGFDFNADAVRRARAAGGRWHARTSSAFRSARTPSIWRPLSTCPSVSDDRAALGEMARVAQAGGSVILNVTALDQLRGDHSDVWGELRRYHRDRAAACSAPPSRTDPYQLSLGIAGALMLAVRRRRRCGAATARRRAMRI